MQPGMNLLYPTKVLKTKMQSDSARHQLIDALMSTLDLDQPVNEKIGQDLFDWNLPEVAHWAETEVMPVFDQYLNQTLGCSLDDYAHRELKAWLTGTQGNYNMILHNHSGSFLSAVFYLLAEEQDQGGELIFCDPRINANRGYTQEWNQEFDYTRVQPQTGDVFVFPSFLYHFVTPYNSRFRLCVPVDLFLFRKP